MLSSLLALSLLSLSLIVPTWGWNVEWSVDQNSPAPTMPSFAGVSVQPPRDSQVVLITPTQPPKASLQSPGVHGSTSDVGYICGSLPPLYGVQAIPSGIPFSSYSAQCASLGMGVANVSYTDLSTISPLLQSCGLVSGGMWVNAVQGYTDNNCMIFSDQYDYFGRGLDDY